MKIKVADFGISKILPNLSKKASTFTPNTGTLQFNPPEIKSNSQLTYSYPVDIWNLGLTILNMLTRSIGAIEFEDLLDKIE